MIVIGSNYGRPTTPRGCTTARANPRAQLEIRGVAREVTAEGDRPGTRALSELASVVYPAIGST